MCQPRLSLTQAEMLIGEALKGLSALTSEARKAERTEIHAKGSWTSFPTALAFCLRFRPEEIIVAPGKVVLLTAGFEDIVEVVGIRGVQRGQK